MQSWPRGTTSGMRAGGQAHATVAAQGVAQQHGVVLRLVDGREHLLQAGRHARLADVVQALGQELDIDVVLRAGDGRAQTSRYRISQAIKLSRTSDPPLLRLGHEAIAGVADREEMPRAGPDRARRSSAGGG